MTENWKCYWKCTANLFNLPFCDFIILDWILLQYKAWIKFLKKFQPFFLCFQNIDCILLLYKAWIKIQWLSSVLLKCRCSGYRQAVVQFCPGGWGSTHSRHCLHEMSKMTPPSYPDVSQLYFNKLKSLKVAKWRMLKDGEGWWW